MMCLSCDIPGDWYVYSDKFNNGVEQSVVLCTKTLKSFDTIKFYKQNCNLI